VKQKRNVVSSYAMPAVCYRVLTLCTTYGSGPGAACEDRVQASAAKDALGIIPGMMEFT
jgi:hypothetical protein